MVGHKEPGTETSSKDKVEFGLSYWKKSYLFKEKLALPCPRNTCRHVPFLQGVEGQLAHASGSLQCSLCPSILELWVGGDDLKDEHQLGGLKEADFQQTEGAR